MSKTSNAEAAKQAGNAAFGAKDYAAAIKHYTEAIALDPKNHVLYSNRSGAYAAQQKYEDALDDAVQCVKLMPEWPKGYARKALAEYHMQKLQAAKKTYETGLLHDPQNEALLSGLRQAEAYIAQNKSEILRRLDMALASNQKLKQYANDVQYKTALLEIIQGIEENTSMLELALSNPDPRIKEGLLAFFGIDIPNSSEGYNTMNETSATRPPTTQQAGDEESKTAEEKEALQYKAKGNELYSKRKFDEALAAYDKAIELDPKELSFIYNKAAVYIEKKEYETSIKLCQEAIDNRTQYKADYSMIAKVYTRMAVCYEKLVDYDNCITMYEKALMEDNNRHIRKNLKAAKSAREKKAIEDYINPEKAEHHKSQGNAFFAASDFPAAKKEYDEAIRRNPKDAKLYSNRAAALMKLLEYPSALKDIDEALALDPNFVRAWVRKGNLHMCLKEYAKALQAFESGLKVDPNSAECLNGKRQIYVKIQEGNESSVDDEDRIKRALEDPEIQEILRDPQINLILKNLMENPKSLAEYAKDPKISYAIQKLIASGIVKMGNA